MKTAERTTSALLGAPPAMTIVADPETGEDISCVYVSTFFVLGNRLEKFD